MRGRKVSNCVFQEFTGDNEVDKLILEFTRREEENYALFNYINEVNTELKNLSDNVKMLRVNIGELVTLQYTGNLPLSSNYNINNILISDYLREARWPRGQCTSVCDRGS
jgi:hypothetical protein